MKAIEYYQIAAQQNHSEALVNLGNIFLNNQNFGKAKEYFEMAAKLDNSEALNYLGNLYSNGQGVEKDYQKAKEYYEKAVKLNNFEAYNRLGVLYLYGTGVKQDYSKAKEYFEIAAEHNQSNGLVNLGMIYLKGFGVQKDLNKAVEYFEKAASFNNSDALNWLGHLHLNGVGIPQNFPKAKEYFELAIKQNNFDALVNLGLLYLKGRGVDKDINKAKKYFELGASKNNSEAFNCLGNFYLSEEEGVQDFAQARKYFELAIKYDNSNAITNLGLLYLNGQGVEPDLNKARELFEKGASLNNSTALLMLGDIYSQGIGVEQNCSKAIQCYKDAISLNDYKGYSRLGKMYYNDYQGVERDVLRSKDYFELAAKHNDTESLFYLFIIYAGGEGNVKEDPVKAEQYIERYLTSPEDYTKTSALCIIGMFYFEGSCFKKDYKKAKIYFELSSERKFSYATFYLALIYWKGLGLERNYSKAKEYFELAIDQGNLDSYFYLGYIYENGKGVEIDLNKAIEFYSKCAENQSGGSSPDNKNYYRSNNDIGLIYLLEKEVQNLQLAEKYLKMAGLNEYQLCQNNLALFLKNFSELNYDSEYFLLKASKKQFALSEFNLALFYEKDEKFEKSIEFFEKASNDEDQKFVFQNDTIDDDERLEISKTFVVCYSNLKLTNYYLTKEKVENAREFFLKSIFKPLFKFLFYLRNESYSFVFKFEHNKLINLKNFFLNFPLFNLQNQINNANKNNDAIFHSSDWSKDEIKTNNSIELFIENNEEEEIPDEKINIIYKHDKKSKMAQNDDGNDLNLDVNIEQMFNQMNNSGIYNLIKNENDDKKFKEFKIKSTLDSTERSLKYPTKLYKLIFQNLNEIQSDVDDVMSLLKSFFDSPPFPILFGRIKIKTEDIRKLNKLNGDDINEHFYDGFND